MDSLVYNTFATKFNEEYADTLNENQKKLLGNYVSSFTDNGLSLKTYLNEEVGRLKVELERIKKNGENTQIKEKVSQVYDILDGIKEREIDTQMLEIVLNTQHLLEEIEENGS